MAAAASRVPGQARGSALADTLAAAWAAAPAAGVTRLADLSGLDPIGLPVFQAVRPLSRGLSVTLGKGATPRAAIVSALVEAIEIATAERLAADRIAPLATLGADALALWHDAPRDGDAVRLDPDRPRGWIMGADLAAGVARPLPLDLVSLDFTIDAAPDTPRSSVGLATGNTRAEALVGAVAELVEHACAAGWRALPPPALHACEIDLAGIDDPLVRRAIARIRRAGRRVRLWSTGQDDGIAAFDCFITDDGGGDGARDAGGDTALPPVRGSACHPERRVAALSAILEAAQGRAALIAGTREDIVPDDYRDAAGRTRDLAFATLAFAAPTLRWADVPDAAGLTDAARLARLLAVAQARGGLPVLAVDLPQPHPGLFTVKAVAPGLRSAARPRQPIATVATRPRRTARRILFAGPTLGATAVPAGIEVRPPAVAGDLAALLRDPPEVVGLVDGCFETAPAVWHREILDLLAQGVAVIGAASLGALRAAELQEAGMIGAGAVFAAYAAGLIRRDDAVMVSHAPAALGHRPLTVALVDAEAALLAAALAAAERRMLQRIARTMPFRRRTWPAMLAAYRARTGQAPAAAAAALAASPSLKQHDLAALLTILSGPPPPRAAAPRPPLTAFYRALLAAG